MSNESKIKCAYIQSLDRNGINPTIKKEEFESLGFRQTHFCADKERNGTWSVYYCQNMNPLNVFDILLIEWFCGTERYHIRRETKGLQINYMFNGFLRDKADLELVLSLMDLTIFYEGEYTKYTNIKQFS